MIEQLNQLSQELAQRRKEFQGIKDKVKQLGETAKQISLELQKETGAKLRSLTRTAEHEIALDTIRRRVRALHNLTNPSSPASNSLNEIVTIVNNALDN
jgi:archaellum component FlaC